MTAAVDSMTAVDRQALSEAVDALLGDDEDARYDAAWVIVRMGRPVLPRALAWADDPRPRMREMACFILGQIGDREATGEGGAARLVRHYRDGVPVLLRLLEKDPEPGVRAAAAAALGQQKVPATVPALARGAGDSSGEVRLHVAMALGSFYGEEWTAEDQPHRDQAAAALLRLMDDRDSDVRDWATFGVHQGGHDTPQVRARLWQALDDPDSDVRGEAVAGLALFGDRGLIPRLDQLLREDPDLPSHFFEAAQELGDPALLPAVEAGAERWREMDGGELHYSVTSALEAPGGAGGGRAAE